MRYIRAIRLVNFRNYADASVVFSPGLNVVYGENAQGKTNLLEGVAFAASGSSPRTANDSEVVRWGAGFARAEMRVSLWSSCERRVSVGYAPGQRKRLIVDGAPVGSLAEYAAGAAGVRAITFFPDDIRIVKGAPSDRREFIDSLLSTLKPSYARAASEYTRAVQQRNQLLRRIRDGLSSRRTLDTWDRKVIQLGLTLLKERSGAFPALAEHFTRSLRALYGPEKAAVRYRYSTTPETYVQALRDAHEGDIERGTTSIGPHRDDLEVLLGGVNLTTYGSQGQQRLATLGLKIAAREFIRELAGEDPILLFDDVMSELDERRRRYLAEYFLGSAQALVSTTNLEYFEGETLSRSRVVRVRGGAILEVAKGEMSP
ncbi:DNA replication/repair protein RecF [Rubrobacter calidifluminis]|uniref:DNA replication/repair protein RecF n=1 Tax=Rubrobacter calidifluminis TaxID=1392640 RepID=UPI002360CE2D|nr:DNA replication/repair protein RecF [Rubrobacter calidifluminis]